MSPLLLMLTLSLGVAADVAPTPDAEGVEDVAKEESTGPERSVPPGVQPAEWMNLAEPEVHQVAGHDVWHVRVPGVRKVEVVVYLWSGAVELVGAHTEATQALGFASRATEGRDEVAMEIETDLHDIDVSAWSAYHRGGASVSAPAESLDRALEILGEVLHKPTFPKTEVKQHIRDKTLYLTVDGPSSLSRSAWGAMANGWYPADHPYGTRPDLKALKKLKTKDLQALHQRWRASGPVTALVVGDVAFEDIATRLEPVLEGLGADGERAEPLAFEAPQASRIVAVDMPGQAQAALRLRYAAPERGHADQVAFDAASWVLGGHFLSRLNANLREDKGFTYGAGASYGAYDTRGTLTVYVDVKSENTAEAIAEIDKELATLASDGITAREKAMAKEALLADWNGTRETARSARWFYADRLEHEEAVADALAHNRAIDTLDTDMVQQVVERWLVDAPRLWVVAGDRKAVEPQLEGLGLDVVWVTPEDAILGSFD